jgi:hypothetical protein
MSTATRRSFQAKYDGTCGTCPAPIAIGDGVFYATPGAALVSGLDCCGDRPDEDLVTVQHAEEPDEDLTVDVAKVMPRGRTARDACPTCWQVPASNGTCGCSY